MIDKERTRQDLQDIADWWKDRLGLSHWEFKVRLWSRREADEQNAYAMLDHCMEKRIAWLNVLDPNDADDSESLTTFDPEVAIVHELLHVYTEQIHPRRRHSPENIKAEQMAHFVALALVRLKREARSAGFMFTAAEFKDRVDELIGVAKPRHPYLESDLPMNGGPVPVEGVPGLTLDRPANA